MPKWTPADMPDLREQRIIVTGANCGLGLETARELARAGAHVILACRSIDRGNAAIADIQSGIPNASLEVVPLDLASLQSVASFVDAVHARGEPIDRLINNAGVMGPPFTTTAEGYELQFGVNHLGHFALTGGLLPMLLRAERPRVVNVASVAHRRGRMNLDNVRGEGRYSRWAMYAQSKLANLLFTFELARRAEAASSRLLSVAAHPGVSQTELPRHNWIIGLLSPLGTQSSARGAEPTLRAAAAEDVQSGEYYGPDGFNEYWGSAVRTTARPKAHDQASAQALWELSENATGVSFSFS